MERQLSAYLDEQLDAMQRQAVEQHLKECSACDALLRAMRLGMDVLRNAETVEVSDAFSLRLRERLPQKRPSLWQRWMTTLRWGWAERQRVAFRRVTVAAVGVAVLAVSWTGMNRHQEGDGGQRYVQQPEPARIAAQQYAQKCAERHSLFAMHQTLGDAMDASSGLTEQ